MYVVSVQYNGGFLPDILLLTQAPIFVCFDGNTRYYIITTTLLTTRYILGATQVSARLASVQGFLRLAG